MINMERFKTRFSGLHLCIKKAADDEPDPARFSGVASLFGAGVPNTAAGMALFRAPPTRGTSEQILELLRNTRDTYDDLRPHPKFEGMRGYAVVRPPSPNMSEFGKSQYRAHGINPDTMRKNIVFAGQDAFAASPSGTMRHGRLRRPSKLDLGALAHELGHAQQRPWTITSRAYMGGKILPALATWPVSFMKDQDRARNVAIAGTAIGAPMVGHELGASYRGAKLLGQLKDRPNLLKRLSTFKGVPTYLTLAAMPALAYNIRKRMGGYTA